MADPNLGQNAPHPPGKNVYGLATRFGDLVRSLVVVMFWLTLACAACAATYVAIRAVLCGGSIVLRALGAS